MENNDSENNELKKIIFEFLRDILNTFPELREELTDDLQTLYLGNGENSDKAVENLKQHFKMVYPERFFDILYENEKIFSEEKELYFLPGIEFRRLWNDNISDHTRKTIWKYLQLILFSIVSNISDTNSFKDTATLFQAINEDEFKKKLEDTISSIQDLFKQPSPVEQESTEDMKQPDMKQPDTKQQINLDELPDADSIHEHISVMMNGKLGKLAKEIAEETAQDLNLDTSNVTNMNDLFQNLLKNPTKLMQMVKNVGSKLDDKIKSGDIKESELLQEASEMMKNMKNMPGMENIHQMMGKLGLNLGNQKVNTNAVQAQLQRNLRIAQQRERMKNKIKENNRDSLNPVELQKEQKEQKIQIEQAEQANKAMNELLRAEGFDSGIEKYVFRSGEKPTKSSRQSNIKNKKHKKKGKTSK